MKTNSELQRDVLDELECEPDVDPGDIGVGAKDGIVTLSGNVKSYAEKRSAVRATERVKGVIAVVDELKIRVPSSIVASDLATMFKAMKDYTGQVTDVDSQFRELSERVRAAVVTRNAV